MKKVLFTALVAVSSLYASAQVKYGVKAGINIANLKASGDGGSFSTDSKVDLVAGGFAEISVAESFAIQPELLYSGEGAKSGDSKINLGFINVPVLAKYKVANSGFGVYLGPQIGFLMSAKAKGDGDSEDIKDDFKSTNLSGVFGAEYTFGPGIIASARYQLGLSDLAKESGDGKLKSNLFQITVGYAFGGKK